MSAPVLGFDLARIQGGSAVADVLLRGLSLTKSDIEVVANSGAGVSAWDRLTLWQDVDEAARRRQTARDVTVDGGDLAAALAVLERAPIGTVDGLLHCVRYDVLDWTWRATADNRTQSESAGRATAILCDAVVAAYLRDLLPVQSRRHLAGGWLSAARWLPVRPIHLGPHHDAITELLARVRSLHAADLRRMARAAEANRRAAADWAPAVHAASWAVYVSERVRVAAAAQLMLVQAVDDAAVPVADRAAGVWNLLSGAVQALVVRDMLDGDTVGRLVEPYVTALGLSGIA